MENEGYLGDFVQLNLLALLQIWTHFENSKKKSTPCNSTLFILYKMRLFLRNKTRAGTKKNVNKLVFSAP